MSRLIRWLKQKIDAEHVSGKRLSLNDIFSTILAFVVAFGEGYPKHIKNAIIILCVVFTLNMVWALLCQIGSENIIKKILGIRALCHEIHCTIHKNKYICTIAYIVALFFVFFTFTRIMRLVITSEAYPNVQEHYGMIKGVGGKLNMPNRKRCSDYWVITDYKYKNTVVLQHHDAFCQVNLLNEYSSLYDALFLQSLYKIEIKCSGIGRNRKANEIIYSDENGKKTMHISIDESGGATIDYYDIESAPQLLNSCLLSNETGMKIGLKNNSQRYVTEYNDKGYVSKRYLEQKISNAYGIRGEMLKYDDENQIIEIVYLGENLKPVCDSEGIMSVVLDYKNGRISEISFYSDERHEKKTEGYNGSHREKYTYDNSGNILSKYQYDRNGHRCFDKNCVSGYVYDYDLNVGRLCREEYVDVYDEFINPADKNYTAFSYNVVKQGSKRLATISFNLIENNQEAETMNDYDYAISNIAVDKAYSGMSDGNELQSDVNEGKDNKLAENTFQMIKNDSVKNAGAENAIRLLYYKGNILSIGYCNLKGDYVINSQGYAIIEKKYDKSNRLIEEIFLDDEKKVCVNNDGISKVKIEYMGNEGGDKKSTSFYDTNDNLVLNRSLGYAKIIYERGFENEDGKEIIEHYFNEKGDAIRPDKSGYDRKKIRYDSYGHVIKETYIDINDKNVMIPQYGYATICYEYDNSGNKCRECYLDEKGDEVNCLNKGYAAIEWMYEGKRLVSVEYKDKDNSLIAIEGGGYAKTVNKYLDGRKSAVEYYDTDGKATINLERGYSVVRYEYNDRGQIETCSYFDVDGKSYVVDKKNGCACIKYNYDNKGNVAGISYFGCDGKPTISSVYHCAGMRIKNDMVEDGRERIITYLGVDSEKTIRDDYGCVIVKEKYDLSNNLMSESYHDENETPVIKKDAGFSYAEYTYVKDKVVRRAYFDEFGNLVTRADCGYAIVQYEYDNAGSLMQEMYYGADEKSIISNEYLCAGMKYEYDTKGNRTDVWYVDRDSNLLIRQDLGYAHVHYEYDHYGQKTEVSYFDCADNPILCKGGAYASYKVDNNINEKEYSYYGIDDNLIYRKDRGYAICKEIYDACGRLSDIRYYDVNRRPILARGLGYAELRNEYDKKNGLKIKQTYFDEDGCPTIRYELGCHELRMTYDRYGNWKGEEYLDERGKLIPRKDTNYSELVNEYDTKNRLVEQSYYNEGKRVINKQGGFASLKKEYDEYGRKITETFLGIDLMPMVCNKQCAIIDYKYDKYGNNISISYLGKDGTLIVNGDLGYAESRREFDSTGRLIGEMYYGTDGRIAKYKKRGYMGYKRELNAAGRVMATVYIDENGEAIESLEGGYAKVVYKYDEFGNCLSTAFFDLYDRAVISNNNYCAEIKREFDMYGNQVSVKYLGTDSEEVVRNDLGYAEERNDFDAAGNIIKTSYFNADEMPAYKKDTGYSSVSRSYDIYGNLIRTHFFEDYGVNTISRIDGCAGVKYERDHNGLIISEKYVGIDGGPYMNSRQNCAGMKFKYDDYGRKTDTWYLGLDDSIIDREDTGCAHIHTEYDNAGNEIEIRCYNKNEIPVPSKWSGAALKKQTNEYNADGRTEKQYFFDEWNRPIYDRQNGCAVLEIRYDTKDREVDRRYLDADGTPIISNVWNNAGMNTEYDELDEIVRYKYVGIDGEELRAEDTGGSRNCFKYDEIGNKEWEWHENEKGTIVNKENEAFLYVRYNYNVNNLLETICYVDKDGHYAYNTSKQCAGIVYGYDDRNNQVYEYQIGENGKIIKREDTGTDYIYRVYNDEDQIISEGNYIVDEDGTEKLVNHIDKGYAYVTYEYTYDKVISECYYDEKGNPTINRGVGCSKVEYSYNAKGLIERVCYYDENGELCENHEGVAEKQYAYNDAGIIEDVFLYGVNKEILSA